MCIALTSPENRALAAASVAAPSESRISMTESPPSSCAENAVPAGVAVRRESSQKSPTRAGSSSRNG